MDGPWTERHRPWSLSDVVGNPQAVAAARRWAEAWRQGAPKERALLLAGPPGSGKTSTAHALAREFNWGLIELNASDARNAAAIGRVAGVGAVHQSFTPSGDYRDARKGERQLIVLDEADNLYERASDARDESGRDLGDRGGKRAIVDLVSGTRQPVVLIVNDSYALLRGSGARLRRLCLTVTFRRLTTPTIRKVLSDVASSHDVSVDEPVLASIAARAQGDLRSALNDLEAVAAGRHRVQDLGDLDLHVRNRTGSAFDMVAAVLKGTDIHRAIEAARNVDEPPDFLVTWIDENLPVEYRDPGDLARAYDMLSRADVFLGRTRRRQAYSLWGYATELAAGGVAASKTRTYATPPRYRFPSWIRAMAATKGLRGMRERVGGKIGARFHMGASAAVKHMVPAVRRISLRDPTPAVHLSLAADLDEDEIAFLLGPEAPKSVVEEVVGRVERRREEGPRAHQAEFVSEPPQEIADAPSEPAAPLRHRRTSLGDF